MASLGHASRRDFASEIAPEARKNIATKRARQQYAPRILPQKRARQQYAHENTK
jgi:hypothetical protein